MKEINQLEKQLEKKLFRIKLSDGLESGLYLEDFIKDLKQKFTEGSPMLMAVAEDDEQSVANDSDDFMKSVFSSLKKREDFRQWDEKQRVELIYQDPFYRKLYADIRSEFSQFDPLYVIGILEEEGMLYCKNEDILEKYPALLEQKKTHVLYICPLLDSSGLYRMILPAIELNKTDSHSAIVSDIKPLDFSARTLEDYKPLIPNELFSWADYIILSSNVRDLKAFTRKVYRYKPTAQVFLDVDTNLHAMPRHFKSYRSEFEQQKRILIENMRLVDGVLFSSRGLKVYYEKLLSKGKAKEEVLNLYVPHLLSDVLREKTWVKRLNKSQKIRIGIMGPKDLVVDDIVGIKDALLQIQKERGERVEYVFYGWADKQKKEDRLKGLTYSVKGPVQILRHLKTLNELELDIALIPLLENPWNVYGQSPLKYLEFSDLMIPVIASDLPPYRSVIENGVSGLLVSSKEQWVEAINKLIDQPQLRKEIGIEAKKRVEQKYSYTTVNQKAFKGLFI